MQICRVIFFVVCSIVYGYAQIPVWQGFDMSWTYNHRLNRLGSYVYQDSIFTTASSGAGKDSGSFSTHYFLIPEVGRQYHEFKIYKRIEAREKELVQIQIDTILPISYHHSVFYLNGFELTANNDADKLQLVNMGVKMVKGNFDTTFLRINLSLMFDCQSIDCDWINNDVDYDVSLFIGCISFPNEDYISYVKGEIYNGTDAWTRKNNPLPVSWPMGEPLPRFITDLKISLDKAHSYSGIKISIAEGNTAAMKFEQYKPSMKKNAFYKPHGNLSKKSKGNAMYEMNGISLTHPENLSVIYKTFSGSILWKGGNENIFGRNAVRSIPVDSIGY